MKVLIDFDSAIYAIASACDRPTWQYRGRQWESKAIAIKALEAEDKDTSELVRVTNPESWENVERTIFKYTDNLLSDLNDPFQVEILISGGSGNFRYEVATILPYKGNRLQELPYHFHSIKDFVVDEYSAKRVHGVEVDDAVGILYEEGDLIVSPDKDLDQLPGLHYNPMAKVDYKVSLEESIQNFYSQSIIGDTSDNIPGLFGIGKSSSYLKQISKLSSEEDIFQLVSKLYEQRFGSYWKQFLLENCRLLHLIRNPNSFSTTMWMEQLMQDYSFYTQEWREKIFEETT